MKSQANPPAECWGEWDRNEAPSRVLGCLGSQRRSLRQPNFQVSFVTNIVGRTARSDLYFRTASIALAFDFSQSPIEEHRLAVGAEQHADRVRQGAGHHQIGPAVSVEIADGGGRGAETCKERQLPSAGRELVDIPKRQFEFARTGDVQQDGLLRDDSNAEGRPRGEHRQIVTIENAKRHIVGG
jgi:hypothetical protein